MARNQCNSRSVVRLFAPEIQNFAELFVQMQQMRHEADYSPNAAFSRHDVMHHIDQAENTIVAFNASDRSQRRAFAIYVLFRQRT